MNEIDYDKLGFPHGYVVYHPFTGGGPLAWFPFPYKSNAYDWVANCTSYNILDCEIVEVSKESQCPNVD